MKTFAAVASSLLCVLFLQSAVAADKPESAIKANDKASFEAVSSWVRKQMDAGGRYAETPASDRATVNTKLDLMGKLFEQHGAVDQMSQDDKVALFNNQEAVNSILGKHDGDRLICRNERPIGSNIPVKTCQSARELDMRRRNDTKDFQRRQDVQKQTKWD